MTLLPSDEVKKLLKPKDRELYDWYYELTRDPHVSTLLFGMAMAAAAERQTLTHMEILRSVKEKYEEIINRPPS